MLLETYKHDSDITLRFNFNQISFISRSAAQQLILEKKDLEKKRINIVFSNLETQINQMIELAAHKLDRKKLETTQKTFNPEELEEYLMSF
jgi:anti-anti-sigma regulatory factor